MVSPKGQLTRPRGRGPVTSYSGAVIRGEAMLFGRGVAVPRSSPTDIQDLGPGSYLVAGGFMSTSDDVPYRGHISATLLDRSVAESGRPS